ncbi:MAG: hypothetical protein ACTHMM_05545 [Agriterribacter sp.]
MPQTTIKKKTARGARRNLRKRNLKKGNRRQAGNRSTKAINKIIGSSLYALKFDTIPGVVVEKKFDGKWKGDGDDDYDAMYNDLFAAYKRYCVLTGNEISKFDPLAAGVDLGKSLFLITQRMKEAVPHGYHISIDKNIDSSGYCFTIYKEVDFQQYWHYFNIEPVIKYLEKKDPELLWLFVSAINALVSYCDFQTWRWLYGFDIVVDDWSREDYIRGWSENGEHEQSLEKEFTEEVQKYTTGPAAKYYDFIKGKKCQKDPKKLLSEIKSLRRRNPIKNWITAAAQLVNDKWRIRDFCFDGDASEYEDAPVRLHDQITIIWSDDDNVYKITCEYMDNEAANFGTEAAIINFPVSKKTKAIDLQNYKEGEKWMSKIDDLFQQYQDVIKYVEQ